MSVATDPRRGDGFTSTHALRPCTCPTCGGELLITCPNACADAADGVDGHVSPAALLPRPAGRDRLSHTERARRDAARESRRVATRVRGVNGTGTKGQIMAALRGAPSPLTVPKIAARLEAPYGRISMACGSLVRDGHVVRVKRGEYRAV